jgi:hypothetical protein
MKRFALAASRAACDDSRLFVSSACRAADAVCFRGADSSTSSCSPAAPVPPLRLVEPLPPERRELRERAEPLDRWLAASSSAIALSQAQRRLSAARGRRRRSQPENPEFHPRALPLYSLLSLVLDSLAS